MMLEVLVVILVPVLLLVIMVAVFTVRLVMTRGSGSWLLGLEAATLVRCS